MATKSGNPIASKWRVHGQWLNRWEMMALSDALLDCGYLSPCPKGMEIRRRARRLRVWGGAEGMGPGRSLWHNRWENQ